MNMSAQFKQLPPFDTGGLNAARDEGPRFTVSVAGSELDSQAGFPHLASVVLEDVRLAMERNRPEGARVAALRLVSLLTPPSELACARGGLAPWQRQKIDRYIRDHLARSIQIEELAQHISLSISHFCRAFKETFSDTPHAYLIRLRLEAAKEMMLSTAEPLSQIAVASGFADQAHLSKQFRRVLSDSPSAWRRRNRTDPQAAITNGYSTTASGQPSVCSHIQAYKEQRP
jgi:AraC family transcriptional regulator